MMTNEQLAAHATAGDEAAMAALVERLQDRVYGLSMRMLGHPEDAREATQEILLKAITRLSTFRGEAKLTTWVRQIGIRHLLAMRRSRREVAESFEETGARIDACVTAAAQLPEAQVADVLRNEIRLSCTHGMLVCLARDERASFILGGILELSSSEAAALIGCTPQAHRQRLSRGRRRLEDFMRQRCGVLRAENPCRCTSVVSVLSGTGRLEPEQRQFAGHPLQGGGLAGDEQREFIGLMDVVSVMCTQPDYAAPQLLARLRSVLHPTPPMERS